MTTINVLDHGRVQLLDSMGDDLAVVNAAQASFDRESNTYGDRERRILRSLMREEHGVPFEHAVLKYKLRWPIFVARQFVKHRMSSWSEHSGRYSAMEPLFYVPEVDQVRTQVGKPMEYQFAPLGEVQAEQFRNRLANASLTSWQAYLEALEGGVAKEQARLSLPLNLYTTVVWTLNLRSLFNVLRLRLDGHAQYEARVYAEAMEELAGKVVPDALVAFREAGRPKP